MSSSIWTRAELLSNVRHARGACWRVVEAQHHVSTAKLTDNLEEQSRLEALLEETKPPIPEECKNLGYLLFTPFRYGAPYPGSRFRRAGYTPGVFYASELPRTAATEMAFYRLLFYAESPQTPWPSNPSEFTAFSVEYATGRATDLRAPPFDTTPTNWVDPINYEDCQQLADLCRAEGIDVIKSQSARDPEIATNVAILRCRAFASSDATERQTWRIHLSGSGARIFCDAPRMAFNFDRNSFASDPRINRMVWTR